MYYWVDLRRSYMLGAFRDMAEAERVKRQVEAEGKEVVCAQSRTNVNEQAARRWVVSPMDYPDRFLDYTFSHERGFCRTARESLDTAVRLLYQQRQTAYPYIVIARY